MELAATPHLLVRVAVHLQQARLAAVLLGKLGLLDELHVMNHQRVLVARAAEARDGADVAADLLEGVRLFQPEVETVCAAMAV